MKYIILLVSALLILCTCIVSAQESKTNFSGTWVLNEKKSELGEGPGGRRGMAASQMVITQKDNKLVVETTRQNFQGEEMTTTTEYSLDGKETKSETERRTTISTAKWSKDGKILTINSTMYMSRGGQEFSMDSIAKWNLADGMLIIERTMSTPMGDMASKMVYDKAEKK